MKQFGVVIEHDDYKVFYIKGNQTYVSPGTSWWKGMPPAPPYFLAAGAIKGKVRVTGIGKNSIQGTSTSPTYWRRWGPHHLGR